MLELEQLHWLQRSAFPVTGHVDYMDPALAVGPAFAVAYQAVTCATMCTALTCECIISC